MCADRLFNVASYDCYTYAARWVWRVRFEIYLAEPISVISSLSWWHFPISKARNKPKKIGRGAHPSSFAASATKILKMKEKKRGERVEVMGWLNTNEKKKRKILALVEEKRKLLGSLSISILAIGSSRCVNVFLSKRFGHYFGTDDVRSPFLLVPKNVQVKRV